MHIVVGLGNPGEQYRRNRHNAGYMVVDVLATRADVPRGRVEDDAWVAEARIGGQEALLVKPLTFMNRSGDSVLAAAQALKISSEAVVVVHDELDLPAGTVRCKQGGGHGGHNGLRDLITHLGGKDFYRLRIGIGHPGHKDQVTDYVLKKPSRQDRQLIDDAIAAALDVVDDIVDGQFERAMHVLHSRN